MTGRAADMTVSPAPYLPFMDPVQCRVPGLQPLDPAQWVAIDAAHDAQMAYRDHLIATRPDRVALALPEAGDAVTELAALLRSHLVDRRILSVNPDGTVTREDGTALPKFTDIASLGRLCQEDWLILQQGDGQPEYRLVAGNLCFPTGWDLRDKIGRPLTRIHDPVPGYETELSARVNRIFAGIRAESPLWRVNFSVAGTAELHCPDPRVHHTDSDRRFLRTERQTLRRLPETGAVVFGVKVHVTPVEDLDADARAAFRAALAAFSPEMAAYKGGANYLDAAG